MYPYSKVAGALKLSRFVKVPLLRKLKLTETNFLILLASVTGIGAGFASVLFRETLHWMEYFFFQVIYEGFLGQIHPYTLPLVPVMGALLLIPFSLRFPGEINGYGMPKFLIAVNLRKGMLKTRNILVKIVTSSITISSGGSAGVEGPIAQVGGAVGSTVARFFELGTKRVTALVACGTAAGIAAQFNAPIAGVLFAQEIILLGAFKLEVFGAIIIASGLATAVSRAFYSSAPVFGELAYAFDLADIFLYVPMGLFIGVSSAFFIRFFYAVGDFFSALKIHSQIKPVLGAFVVGCLGLIHFGTLSDGHSVVASVLHDPSLVGTGSVLLLLFCLKFLATPITLGSGNVGGVFAPSLFLGAMLGGFYGTMLDGFFPGLNIDPSAFAFVGMGAFLAATIHAPLTSIFLLFELTSDYAVIIPIMLSSVVGMLVSRHFCPDSIDTLELTRQGIRLQDGKEASLMASVKIDEVYDRNFEYLRDSMTFSKLMEKIRAGNTQYFPVLNRKEELCGVISFNDVREIIMEEGIGDLVIVGELMKKDVITITPEENLIAAMTKFAAKDVDILPVVSQENPKQLIGVVNKHDVILAYNKASLIKIADDAK